MFRDLRTNFEPLNHPDLAAKCPTGGHGAHMLDLLRQNSFIYHFWQLIGRIGRKFEKIRHTCV